MSTPTQIQPDVVGIFHYTLRDDAGTVLDSSVGGDPMAYLHGAHGIVPGLERAFEGKTVGDKFTAVVPPEDGYGMPIQVEPWLMPLSQLPAGVRPGVQLFIQTKDGQRRPVWVKSITGKEASLSYDHPLAGQTLHFECEIVGIRAATLDEKTHRHAHGLDGHATHGHGPGNQRGGARRSLAKRPSEKKKKK